MSSKLVVEIINLPKNFDNERLSELDNTEISISYTQTYLKPTNNVIKKHVDFFLIIEDQLSFMEVFEITTAIRKSEQAVIFLLIEPEHEVNKLFYLKIGADIVVKIDESFDVLKCMMLNLGRLKVQGKPSLLKNKQFTLNESNLSTTIADKEIFLTKNEFRLLSLLNKTPNVTISYRQINEYLWGKKENTQAVNIANIVFKLREKLKQIEGVDKCLITVRSKGYMLDITKDPTKIL
ncbi:hypothetical protein UAY_00087 [Enterococcus moraviensis ATCC BAA-383]|uniref:OmpR/PhoB-type domain-containing protein n=1 Tax=Enterococcus moraviensis ATCC BAA-383 TaxID=1158609 RepID=R2RCJ3_9ENTE|nr:winged helix-turn-helix domain-containing protein [Enterococcus moraviensis]EOI06745.1 hypothetical protein UAY_00087 [Enterococcus moraviensis ATCC BAA-383]EOT65082.1 hypothetical protein I586_02816 [Enterococcus moraviensis ATCC BAA-383]OJG66929.1 hypothetical protein RV09_GL003146 [Enterococcus moraviensis]